MRVKLIEVTKGRNNNLDILRFFAAILVILCHSFPISLGIGVLDPLAVLTNDQISFGSLAVSVFFLYGGFLICKSMHRLQTTKAYFKARIIRIFPPLIFVTVILAFIIGPIFTNMSLCTYFTSIGTYKYLLNGVLVLQHNLPGVFEGNTYVSVVNGPLWTLPIEFLCYVMCYVFYKLKLLDKKNMVFTVLIFIIGCVGAKILSGSIAVLEPMIRPMGLFFAGMVYYVYQDYIWMHIKICMMSLVGLVISAILGILPYTIFVFLPYFLMYIGYATRIRFSGFAKRGEISYGIYLSAWPIQQIICQFFGGEMNPIINFGLTVPCSIVAGLIIYKCIEEPVVKWMKK